MQLGKSPARMGIFPACVSIFPTSRANAHSAYRYNRTTKEGPQKNAENAKRMSDRNIS
jgi:hypothetical protein